MTQAYNKLRELLKELFQLDRAEDLDFGIYRIMNHKRDEISTFLDQDLLSQVRQAFDEYRVDDEVRIYSEMEEVKKSAAALGVPLESSAKYQDLKTRLKQLGDLTTLENDVYSDLYTIFRRYYKNGDFLSLRRYRPGVYAVPYEGEEVKLHWANADQYYVKTTENFRNYRFGIEDVGYVSFELVAR